MFKIKTSLIQGFTALLITTSSLWATPNQDDDNAQAVVSRGMEAPAIQSAPSVITIQTSESSTALVTKDKVWPRKWSPFQHQEGWGKLHLHAIDRIFRHLMKADGIESIKSAAFSSRHWHYYTQTLEFKQALISTIKFQTGGNLGHNPGHPEKLFKPHRPYFLAFDKRTLSKLVHDKTFMNCLSSKSPKGQKYLEDFETTRQVASDPQTTSLILKGGVKQGVEDPLWKLILSPTLHFDLGQLTELDLEDNNLTDLPDVGGMTNLQVLNLRGNQFKELPNLSLLVKLTSLNVAENKLNNIPGLGALVNLEDLNLNNNNVTSLEGLGNLHALRVMSAQKFPRDEKRTGDDDDALLHNSFCTAPGLENLTNLVELNLNECGLEFLPDLSRIATLEKLHLNNNKLSRVTGLESLTSLTELNLRSNHLTDLPSLGALTNLDELDVASNRLSRIQDLEQLTQLYDIYLQDNQITEVPNFAGFQNLGLLFIWNNPVSTIRINGLTRITQLGISPHQRDELDLTGFTLFTESVYVRN